MHEGGSGISARKCSTSWNPLILWECHRQIERHCEKEQQEWCQEMLVILTKLRNLAMLYQLPLVYDK